MEADFFFSTKLWLRAIYQKSLIEYNWWYF